MAVKGAGNVVTGELLAVNRSVTRRYHQADGTWVTVTERQGTRRRRSWVGNYYLGPQNYRTTTTTRRHPDGTTITEREEHHPWAIVFAILLAIGGLADGYNSPDWYWVLAAAVGSVLLAAVLIGGLISWLTSNDPHEDSR